VRLSGHGRSTCTTCSSAPLPERSPEREGYSSLQTGRCTHSPSQPCGGETNISSNGSRSIRCSPLPSTRSSEGRIRRGETSRRHASTRSALLFTRVWRQANSPIPRSEKPGGGWTLAPLPSTRKEVEAIASLYPKSHVYLGREATEERAKSLGTDSGLIHFACHGLLDERFPLNSALALTLPEHPAEGQENGLLQAWEIFESMHLDADLVTLSACDTALGKEMGGEGLVGLTRAFQYAGARSVLASLWGVADYSTARFMERFYRYLLDGKPKDEALRAAQIDQIREKGGSSHPFFWAAFELNGDWR